MKYSLLSSRRSALGGARTTTAWLTLALASLSACTSPAADAASTTEPASTRPRTVEARSVERLVLPDVVAHVVPSPDGIARPTPPFTARIELIHVRPGDTVERGAPLFEVSMPDVVLAAARIRGLSSRRVMRRGRREELAGLEREGLVERARVFDEETALASLDAEHTEALATLRAASVSASDVATVLATGRVTLRSPIAGIVRDVRCALGDVREPAGGPLAEIVGATPARIEARFPRGDRAHMIPEGSVVTFVALDDSTTALDARPDAVLVDPLDGTTVVWLHPMAGDALPPGLAGRVSIDTPVSDAVEVPSRAVAITDGRTVLVRWVADREETVEVTVLTSSERASIVRATNGATLAAGDQISIQPALEGER